MKGFEGQNKELGFLLWELGSHGRNVSRKGGGTALEVGERDSSRATWGMGCTGGRTLRWGLGVGGGWASTCMRWV